MRGRIVRGKDASDNEWITGYYTGYGTIKPLSARANEPREIQVDDDTVGWFSGMRDRNFNAIYEGDVAELFGMRGEIAYECGAFGIGFRKQIDHDLLESKIPNNNTAYFCYNDNFISLWELWWNYEQDDSEVLSCVEIIGNIYDSPELLR